MIGPDYFDGKTALLVRSTQVRLHHGHPSVLVDLADPDDGGKWFELLALHHSVQRKIDEYFNGSCPDWALSEVDGDANHRSGLSLVVGGSEPTLQAVVARYLREASYQFSRTALETGGYRYLAGLPVTTQVSVSPPVRHGEYVQPDYRVMRRADCLRFSVAADERSPRHVVPFWAHDWHEAFGRPIYVSCEDFELDYDWAVEYCMNRGLIFEA